jgi:hypothetical protein
MAAHHHPRSAHGGALGLGKRGNFRWIPSQEEHTLPSGFVSSL